MRNDILNTLKSIPGSLQTPVMISGHSLGAATATLACLDLTKFGYDCVAYTFASPRVGDMDFCRIAKKLNTNLYRIVNIADAVPTLPPAVSPNLDDPEDPFMYSHCGIMKSFSVNWLSTLNNHLIGSYLEGLYSSTL